MTKHILRLWFYILVLAVTLTSAWILNPTKNIGPTADLNYTGPQNGGGTLTVSGTDVEMQVDIQINNKWRYLGSSKDKTFSNRPKLTSVVPNTVVPFRIRFYNTSEHVATVRVTVSGVQCDQILTNKEVVFVSTIGGTEYSQYAGSVTAPSYTYQSLTSGKLVSVSENENGEQMVTYDLVLYEDLQIPPTGDRGYVVIEGYFYFDAVAMTNQCAGKTFEIGGFQAVQT